MDIFTECMVKKKKGTIDYLKVVLCILIIITVLMAMPFVSQVKYVGIILFMVCAGVIYLLYNIIISINLEYEYTFTNGAMDVDKIIAARRRKRITSLNARSIEIMASVHSNEAGAYANDKSIKRYYACTSVDDPDTYFVIYSENDKKYMLIFNPNETIKDGFKRLNPQKVFLAD